MNTTSIDHGGSLPRHSHTDYGNIFSFLLRGSLLLVGSMLAILLLSYFVAGNTYIAGRIVACSVAIIYLLITNLVARREHVYLGSVLLILFYALLSMLILYMWGISTPFGIILLSITIVITSILFEPALTLLVGGGFISFILGLQYAISNHNYMPALSETIKPSHMGDAIAYSCGIGVLILVSWLYSRRTKQLLRTARSAEAALAQEKQLLEVRIKERTTELKKAQLEESRTLYQFVEMGQLSAALIHDLANHLTALTMDLEEMKRSQHAQVVERADASLSSLEQLVRQYRDQLQGNEKAKRFTVASFVRTTLRNDKRLRNARLKLHVDEAAENTSVLGDPLRFVQVLTVLINNALEASKGREVILRIAVDDDNDVLCVHVEDSGKGVPPDLRKQLFKPLQSTKKEGLGIGLFIAHKIVETHFKGNLTCTSYSDPTIFTISLPRYQ